MDTKRTFTAFAGHELIASGDIETAIRTAKEQIDGGRQDPVIFFDDRTGRQIDFDLRGTPEEALARLASHPEFAGAEAAAQPKSGPGRPNLGVVCREVSLLPRHWEWLAAQSGTASATIRRLVDEDRKRNGGKERARIARDAAGTFMWTMGGNLPGFEEASRALFAGDYGRLEGLVGRWPRDIREHLARLAAEAARLQDEAGGGSAAAPAR
ncbi:MAG: DUF2239 family protein [Deltaproteobacteria bacterium]|nr:DUF2239 family protein [Candidatus Zymogenaceae bacterium]